MGKRLSKENCLENNFPELIKEWDFNKNGDIKPYDVSFGSHKKIWWLCLDCRESYNMAIKNKTLQNQGCPYCAGKKVCDWNSLAVKRPDLAKQWHPTLNGGLMPKDVTCGSHRKIYWKCHDCNEVWVSAVLSRTFQNTGCLFCAKGGSKKKVCNWNCLAKKYPEIAKEWHPIKNGTLTPNAVTPGSNKMVWWVCGVCHECYEMLICNRVRRGCPCCSGKRLCGCNCLATKAPDIAKQWHPTKNINLTPNDVMPGSNNKYWWVCSYCGKDTLKSCYQVTSYNKREVICYNCNLYYQEEYIRNILEKLTGKKFPKTRNVTWLFNTKTKRKYEADGYCQELNIIFEHQGPQHCCAFNFNMTMKDFFYQIYKDAEKYRLCKDNNCLLICTYYDQSEGEIEEYIRQTLIDNNVPIQQNLDAAAY